MLFVVHPNQWLPQTGYMMCGEPLQISASGSLALTSTPARLHQIDA